MKYLFALFCIALSACTTSEKITDIAPTLPAPLGYSLGLGCQGMCLDADGDGTPEASATEVMVGLLSDATQLDSSTLMFPASAVRVVYIPDSMRVSYWNNASFMAAIVLRNPGSGTARQRSVVPLPDNRLDVVRDSCLTWNQSAFPEPVPCIPILAIKP